MSLNFKYAYFHVPILKVHRKCLHGCSVQLFALLRPNLIFRPKNIGTSFGSREIVLKAFHCRVASAMPGSGIGNVHAMFGGIQVHTAAVCVCYSDAAGGHTLSKQRLSRELCEAICLAYTQQGLALRLGFRAHSTWSVAVSMTVLRGLSVEDICPATSWSSPSPFVRFYMLDMTRASIGHSVLESGAQLLTRCENRLSFF